MLGELCCARKRLDISSSYHLTELKKVLKEQFETTLNLDLQIVRLTCYYELQCLATLGHILILNVRFMQQIRRLIF
jgi:hypothetical protein